MNRGTGFGHAFTAAAGAELIVVFAIFGAVIFCSGTIAAFIDALIGH